MKEQSRLVLRHLMEHKGELVDVSQLVKDAYVRTKIREHLEYYCGCDIKAEQAQHRWRLVSRRNNKGRWEHFAVIPL